jgi:methylmalonyl-CoA/ethylmalonyl-CoA epimerase
VQVDSVKRKKLEVRREVNAKTATIGLNRIGQISINVHDLKNATAFYRDTLGMNFLFDAPNMAFFDCGGVRLMLAVAEKPEFDHPASIIYYTVEDIHKMHELLTSRGVQFESNPHFVARMPDHELWMAFFRDLDNNMLALMSEVKK